MIKVSSSWLFSSISPDGTRIVLALNDKTVRIWDATTGIQVGEPCRVMMMLVGESLQGHDDLVNSVAFSPDGTRIVSGSVTKLWNQNCLWLYDKTVRIWDATTGIQVGESLRVMMMLVSSVAFSPDGTRIVSGSYDKTVRIWDATLVFRIVSGSYDKTVRIWDATTGIQVGESLRVMMTWLNSVAFSPDGTRIVSGSDDKTVRIWDATTVAFSPDGTRIVSGSDDRTVRIWDATTGWRVPQGHDNVVSSVAFSPDGTRIVSGSYDNTVMIWDATTGIQVGESLQGHNVGESVAFSPDGTRIVSGSYDKTVRSGMPQLVFRLESPSRVMNDLVNSVAFSPDGTRIVSGS
ncbi:hypothetical protein D9757_011892 [Collybiopsis confluens]|uniref:WD40 repeat-like protein n=1 Tax=Collybiopsis confluens TaxID=2823264 RepID=A0A8H5GKE4_9AGAR|nr:hypothetical protein D9757_011892 [Collybiopsis confluens]